MAAPICDFCSHPDVRWNYPARDFKHTLVGSGVRVQAGSRGGWAACEECHKLIQRSDRTGLVTRSAQRMPGYTTFPRELRREMKRELRNIHDKFWSSREGAPTPVPAP